MATRHLIRTIVFQTLYEWDFHNRTVDFVKVLERNLKQLGQDIDEPEFAWSLAQGVVEHLKEIDKIIERVAPEWPIDQIALADRNVLRLGLYELLFGNTDEVPPKVAINEAIEVAKNYGGINSPKFINGVLGTVYREIQEKSQSTENSAKDDSKFSEQVKS